MPYHGRVVTVNASNEAVALASVRRMVRSGEARLIRQRSGVSQAELARAIGATPGAVCHWESGSRIPHGILALRLLATLVALGEEPL